jgi:hypothetical protein
VDSIVKYVISEFDVIKQAPIPFFLCLAVLAIIIWRAISWGYSSVIDSYEARNRLQADQIADYKNKLSGASPDEAKARLDALEAIVSKISPRLLSDEQTTRLTKQLSSNPGRANIALSVSAPNAKLLHASLAKSFKEAGYEINTWVDLQATITHSNISLRVPHIDQLTPRQSFVLSELRGLGIEIVVEHQPDHPANAHPTDIWLVVR